MGRTRRNALTRTMALTVATSIALTSATVIGADAGLTAAPAAFAQTTDAQIQPQTKPLLAIMGDKETDPAKGISNLNDLPAGTTVAWKDGVDTEKIGTKNTPAVVTFPDGTTAEVSIPVTVVLNQEDYAATLKELEELKNKAEGLQGQLNTGLARCIGTIGGSLLALMPAVAIASQLIGGLRLPAVDEFIANTQKQLGAFHPGLARAVDLNRGAIAAAFAGVAITGMALTPLTCRDASVGDAIAEPLSSAQ